MTVPGFEGIFRLLGFFLRRRRRSGFGFFGFVEGIGEFAQIIRFLFLGVGLLFGGFGFAFFDVLLLAGTADFFGFKSPDPLRLFQVTKLIASAEIDLDRRRHSRPLIAERGNRVTKFFGGEPAGEGAFEDVSLF